jgi:hypothetical protein
VGAALEAANHLDLDQEWPDDSIGHNLQLLVGMIFPGMTLDAIGSLRDRRPVEYETTLQAGLSLLTGNKYRRYRFSDEGPMEAEHSGDEAVLKPRPSPDTGMEAKSETPVESEARVSYPQLKFIAGLTGGLWLGPKSLRNHPDFPQDELTRQEAHELIDQLQLIPDSQKERRAALAKKWLTDRFNSRRS